MDKNWIFDKIENENLKKIRFSLSVEKMAKRYMKIGYDREQKYRFPDGSYSVWGPKTDDTGSMWLTSFVVKAFVQASKYIEVDKKSIMESMYWIIKQQGIVVKLITS